MSWFNGDPGRWRPVGPKVRLDIGHVEAAAWTALAEPGVRFSISLVAATESARAGYLAAAELAIATQNTYSTMAVILLTAASVIIGTVLLNGTLVGRGIAYVTIVAGIASIFAPFLIIAGIPEAIGFIGLVLGAVWQFVAGLKLARSH